MEEVDHAGSHRIIHVYGETVEPTDRNNQKCERVRVGGEGERVRVRFRVRVRIGVRVRVRVSVRVRVRVRDIEGH